MILKAEMPGPEMVRAVESAKRRVAQDIADQVPEPVADAKPRWARHATRSGSGFAPEILEPSRTKVRDPNTKPRWGQK
jgi:hypothetical protein